MQEVIGDIWELAKNQVLVFTSNGNVKKNGHAVMGKGIAKEVADRFPYAPRELGQSIQESGNHVHFVTLDVYHGSLYIVYSFPTKHNWREDSDLKLIRRSIKELVSAVDKESADYIYLVRPGCGNGKLLWKDVKPLLSDLDDRFIIVSKE